LIAKEALDSAQVRRLMTVPGVNVICAAIFLAAVGDIKRFKGSRQVVAYLGLDPRVYQSGSSPARGGRISKQGSPQARWVLVEAARSVARQPGPLHAFYERLRARKGHNRRSSPSRASSPRCSIACSPASRTTPTSSPR
jgi:transposase